ncbi:MAG: lipoate--protein ligase family protein [Thermomicrobium sp.]|nr:lipoate--protein ligase family protein [Thermomicrobium sp.]
MNLARWRTYRWQLVAGEAFDPGMQMALDEVLTRRVGAGQRPPTLRFWEWTAPAVVIGRFQSLRNEVDLEEAARHGITVVRRITGGGAMLTEPGKVITYSIYAPLELVADLSFQESYAFLDAWVVEALRALGIDAWYQPINDITSAQGKIGGAAQARRFGAVLHHTTMAYDIDPAKVPRVIRIGREKLSDKGIRSAERRVAPLRQQTELPREAIQEHLIRTFAERHGLEEGGLLRDELEEARELVRTKYGTWEWTAILP